ncbi:MAG: carbamate kinase [bacterium]
MKTAVVAIGGNAILLAGEKGSKEEQIKNLKITCKYLAQLIREGYDLVITHGNGPQVGNILLQNELAKSEIPPMALDVCNAESQGQIGYLLQQTLNNELQALKINKTVVSVITQVLVDKKDPAFKNPTKPIGQYYKEKEAKKLKHDKGWEMRFDSKRGGWRRVVASPVPQKILEHDAILRLIFSGTSGIVVIASGGGGIPVIKTKKGYEGVEAVIDKDLAASVLARNINEKLFIILTDVPNVSINFGKPNQKNLDKTTLKEVKQYLKEGHFAAGSMGPKIKAAIAFLENKGKKVIITSPENLLQAIKGKAGTEITG